MFLDRRDAGIRLAEQLERYKHQSGVLVLALPRGGVVTGYEVACRLNAPFDVLIVRKLGAPQQPELAIGALSETGATVLNRDIIALLNVPQEYIEREVERQKDEIARRKDRYRGGRAIAGLEGKDIILVDDGVATGATVKAAIAAIREKRVRKLILALPVAPPETAEELKALVDEFICLATPLYFISVGSYYADFSQVSDDEVVALLREPSGACKKTS
ncbi:MAG: phosphoribosyltransferase [Nitrospirota bacterium]